ncbi:hypothetical protein JYT25_00615 [bacterium AH-315-C20]|nr:hypothetical protein [bacterium AH-315-C20]
MKRISILIAILSVTAISCKKNKTPDQVTLKSVTVTDFPQMNGAVTWDAADDADLYIKIAESNVVIWDAPSYFVNASNTTDYAFTPATPITITTLTNEVQIDFYDWEDGISDEWMGGVEFFFDKYKEDKESALTLTSGTFTIDLVLEWGNQ